MILFLFTEIEFSFSDLLASLIDLRKLVSRDNKFSISISFDSFSNEIIELGTLSIISLKVFSSRDSRSYLLDFPNKLFEALI